MKRQPTTQLITWFLDLDRNGQLNLELSYQRKSVWSSKDRKYFLDTIFRNYPTSSISIQCEVDDNQSIFLNYQQYKTLLRHEKYKYNCL